MYRADTIVACATPPGRGAIAIVRISGGGAFALADLLVRPRGQAAFQPWRLTRCSALAGPSCEPVDDVLAVRMPAPRTYSGEDIVEIHCHGSPLLVETLIDAAVGLGARLAEPGEFSRRAVLNGRMDLLQAEAVADLIDARVSAAARAAWQQLQGGLSEHLAALRSAIVELLASVEANVDFSDEELPEEDAEARIATLVELDNAIGALVDGFAAAQRHRDGHTVVFAGRPNVGKSSLVNALLGRGRMIVSGEPGTTRDTVEELVDLGGLAFLLTDTAGVVDASAEAERIAVERARVSRAEADIVVVVVDGSLALHADDEVLLSGAERVPSIVVVNKTDLPSGLGAHDQKRLEKAAPVVLRLSALTGEGCPGLEAALVRIATEDVRAPSQPVAISRLRHRTALVAARRALRDARQLLNGDGAAELVALELRRALGEIGSITHPLDNEEVLDRIFVDFCIGK